MEMTVDEEDAVDELDLPLSQQETKTSTRRADAHVLAHETTGTTSKSR